MSIEPSCLVQAIMSEKPIFTGQIQVQFKDADSSGILFFGNIFSLAHQAYESLV